MKPAYDCFIGIDQTGAVRSGKIHLPRALPCAVFDPGTRCLALPEEGLPELSPAALESCVRSLSGRARPRHPAVLVDCVLGLPAVLGGWQLFDRAIEELRAGEERDSLAPFGRLAAEAFFSRVLGGFGVGARESSQGVIPARECERRARANSVFRARPYQKNIQTGTYRIWREISRARAAFAIWPRDSSEDAASRWHLFEGFPSLLWKKLFGLPSRAPQQLPALLEGLGVQVGPTQSEALSRDPDLCDAVVLAVSGWRLQHEAKLGDALLAALAPEIRELALKEGWLAGLGNETF